MQALVAEMVGNFSKRLEPLGIVVRELTGTPMKQICCAGTSQGHAPVLNFATDGLA
jgi:hypothetical protein